MSLENLIVLKFGSSVLGGEDSLPAAVAEIYQTLREGYRIVAVVSAFSGTTDQLDDKARRVTSEPEASAHAALLATGERAAAALLALHLERSGIAATLLDPARVGPHTRGPLTDAEPVTLSTPAVIEALTQRPVVVLPGFIGTDESGATSLLGRGGSDLSALFVAQQLGAQQCRLLKDVNGLFEHDPARTGPAPRRFQCITYEKALSLDPRIIQPKGVRFARDHGLSFEVAAPGARTGTIVGAQTTRLTAGPATASQPRPVRVALLGLGTVGLGVFRRLAARSEDFRVTCVAVRDLDKHKREGVPAQLLTTDPWAVLEQPYDVLVELIGGRDPAAALIEHSLDTGHDVVTANKEVVALIGARLELKAAGTSSRLRYSAAVGGALPAIETVQRVAAAGRIRGIRGVLNGTTNFILDRWASGADRSSAITEAQARGFAEADPSLDLNGFDSACKLAILTRAAFGQPTDAAGIPREGIDQLAPETVRQARGAGGVVRLVASCQTTVEGPVTRVAPATLPPDHPLATARGEENVLLIEPEQGPTIILRGKGAGRWPTSEAVLADLTEIARRGPSRTVYSPIATAV